MISVSIAVVGAGLAGIACTRRGSLLFESALGTALSTARQATSSGKIRGSR
jgi:hypothetical protein